MFGWFRKKEKPPLVFNDNVSAFAHACKVGYPLLLNAVIPALVIEEGNRGMEGEHCYRLKLAAGDGPVEIWGCTMVGAPLQPESGDLVGFRIVRIASELPEGANLIGFITSRLEPVLVEGKGWRVSASLAPDNLKPELHL